MPRDPKDISLNSTDRAARRLGELDDQKDPVRLKGGSSGSEGPEGPEGPPGEGRKSTVGESTATFVGEAENSSVKSVAHELGSKPTHINISVEKAEGNIMFTYRIIERTSTVFKVQINAETAPKENINFTWEALA